MQSTYFADRHTLNKTNLDKNCQSDIKRWSGDAKAIKSALDAIDGHYGAGTSQLWIYEPSAKYTDRTRTEVFCRTAFSIGNLDEANYVTIIVPGTTHSVNGAILTERNSDFGKGLQGPYDIAKDGGTLTSLVAKNAIPLYDKCRSLNTTKKFALVVWMGYRAPMGSPPGPAIWAWGTDGAVKLIADVLSLRGNKGPHHLTISGHSYGSTTTGIAARTFNDFKKPPELANLNGLADALVLLGSPGACAMTAADLGVPKDKVYVCSDYYDIITYLAAFGRDPASKDFGAVTLKSKVPNFVFERQNWLAYSVRWIARRAFAGFTSHSHYYNAGNPSLESIARIAIQESPEKITRCKGRSLGGSWSQKQFNWTPLSIVRYIGISPAMWTNKDVVGTAMLNLAEENLRPLDDQDPNTQLPN
ncbi:alpha/beta hydrolase [Streptomyces sp. NPDC001635]|nr:hypothetical protein E4K10_47270 [Streptomyces sp. T1317-0309]